MLFKWHVRGRLLAKRWLSDGVGIVSLDLPTLDVTCDQRTSGLAVKIFYCFFIFSLFPSISMLHPSKSIFKLFVLLC
jgi:hypothetical protein